jgi:hypothetical protein
MRAAWNHFKAGIVIWRRRALRFRGNKKVLVQLAREFAYYGIDVRFETLEANLSELRAAYEARELSLLQGTLFTAEPIVLDPFRQFLEKNRAEG